jgi:hypothetical protein
VDTEAERDNTEALQTDLASASMRISVSTSLPYNSLPMLLNSDSLFSTQKLIKHSRSKDQYLRVALKRLIETQLLEDELKEVNESNKILLARNQELETQLAEESRERAGKWLISSRYIQSCPNDVLD